jgi:hypothetical protein
VEILQALRDLEKQATEEHSHFYVGKVVREAIAEIETLRYENMLYVKRLREVDPVAKRLLG